MQRDLTAQLSSASGIEIVSFSHFDGLVFSRGEILKAFVPRSHRMMFGTPKDRIVSGDLFLIFEADLIKLRPPSKRFNYSNLLTSVPVANFPGLFAAIVDGALEDNALEVERLLEGVGRLLEALPTDRVGWEDRFGDSSFSRPAMEQLSQVVQYLRSAVNFETPARSGPAMTVTIERPFG